MEIKIDFSKILFWLGMIRFIIVGIVIVVLAFNITHFSELFQDVSKEVSGTLLWVLFMLYALQFFKSPKRSKEGYHDKD